MALVRWNPRHRDRMHDQFDAMLQDFFSDPWSTSPALQADWLPTTDIVETDDRFVVELDLPGMKREEIKISVQNGSLTVKGERKQSSEQSKNKYSRYERSYGSFTRTFQLPNTIDGSRIEASYQDGVLRLVLPKSEAARPREIEVKVN
ncbi:MAG TPA: Hsp20/alpha crystallin family protein [Candidatus Eisenbacteria bacterium]|nr:Hsp20/alpha crystallin family protein [Candidatus Eisenbacteria bacterium]